MVRPDGGGGDSAVIELLDPLYDEICNLIGELAGNEAYVAYLDAQCGDPLHDQPPNTRLWIDDFKVPATYGFSVRHDYWIPLVNGESADPNIKEEIEGAATDAWYQAYGTYCAGTGNASVLREWGRNIWEPDPYAMQRSTDGLIANMSWLQDQLAPGAGWVRADDPVAPAWLTNLGRYWPQTSEGSESFFAFWDDVNEKCALYVNAAERLAQTAAQVTATVGDFQTNLLEVTTKTRDHVETALKQWQQWKGPSGVWPTGSMRDNTGKTILADISYGTGVIALIPPVALVSGVVSVLTGGLTYFLDDKLAVMEATKAADSLGVWSGYFTDVEKVATHMRTALDVIHTRPQSPGKDGGPVSASQDQGFDAYVKMVMADHRDWTPPSVHL